MSYDVYLEIDTGGPEPASVGMDWNYTSNCAPMWRLAGADLAEFDGKKAGECLPYLTKAIASMLADPEPYKALNPENGWGSYRTLVPALRDLAYDFGRHPNATVRISR